MAAPAFSTRYVILGSSADLVWCAPLVNNQPDVDAPTDANRIGAYFDRTLGQEKVGFVIMGTDAIGLFEDRVEVQGSPLQDTVEKSQPNGYASLDGTGRVPLAELPPFSGLNYQGTWNANTNTPTLVSSSGTLGDFYIVSTAGSTVLDGISTWLVGDWVIFDGSVWQRISDPDNLKVLASALDPAPGYLDAKVDGVTIGVNGSYDLYVIGGGITGVLAANVTVSAAGFTGVLSPADTNVQLAMATLDQHTHDIDDLTNVTYVPYTSTPNGTPTVIDSTASGSCWEWTVVFHNGAGVYMALKVLAAATGASTVDYTLYPGTNTLPHSVVVVRSAGTTSLRITALGTGYTASCRRFTMA